MSNYIKINIDGVEYDLTDKVKDNNISFTTGNDTVKFIGTIDNLTLNFMINTDELDYIKTAIVNRKTLIQCDLNLDFISSSSFSMYIPVEQNSNLVSYDYKTKTMTITFVSIFYFAKNLNMGYKFKDVGNDQYQYVTDNVYDNLSQPEKDKAKTYFNTAVDYENMDFTYYGQIKLRDNGMYVNEVARENQSTANSRSVLSFIEHRANELLEAKGFPHNITIQNKDIAIGYSKWQEIDLQSRLNMNNLSGQLDDRFVVCDVISSNFLYNEIADTVYTYDELPVSPTSTQVSNALNQASLDERHIGAIAVVAERDYTDPETPSERYRFVHLIQINGFGAYDMVGTVDIHDVIGSPKQIFIFPHFSVVSSGGNKFIGCCIPVGTFLGANTETIMLELQRSGIHGALGYKWNILDFTSSYQKSDYGDTITLGLYSFDYINTNYFLSTRNYSGGRLNISNGTIFDYTGIIIVDVIGLVPADLYTSRWESSSYSDNLLYNTEENYNIFNYLSDILKQSGLKSNFFNSDINIITNAGLGNVDVSDITLNLRELDNKDYKLNLLSPDNYFLLNDYVLQRYYDKFNNVIYYKVKIKNKNQDIRIGNNLIKDGVSYGIITKMTKHKEVIELESYQEYITQNIPILHYKLQEETGVVVNNFGTEKQNLTNTGTTINQTGKIRNSYYLPYGSSSSLIASEQFSINSNNITVAFWMNYYSALSTTKINILFKTSSLDYMAIQFKGNELNCEISNSNTTTNVIHATPMGSWKHIILSIDSTQEFIRLYVDNTVVDSQIGRLNIKGDNTSQFFNIYSDGTTGLYLEDFRVFNYNLDSNERSNVYNNGIGTLL